MTRAASHLAEQERVCETPLRLPSGMSKSFSIGDLELPGRWLLAPLAGVSDWPFRALALEQGAAAAYTEMISSEGLTRGGSVTLRMLEKAANEDIFAPQIFGSNPVRMAEAARAVEKMGAALVDINMGCPVKKVCRTGAGAALLRDPRRARDIVSAVVDRVSIPVQVKARAGWDAGSVNIVELACRLEEAGAAAMVVHGRTRAQGYSGRASWEIVTEVGNAARRMKVIGNGDIVTANEALERLSTPGVDAVMIGRGAFGYPWIFREIEAMVGGRRAASAPNHEEWRTTILRHMRDLVRYRGGDERGAVRQLRKHLVWYTRGYRGAPAFRAKLASLETAGDVEAALDLHFPAHEHDNESAFRHRPDVRRRELV